MYGPVIRKLARDQWVRQHGTPRVTVLVGGTAGQEIWEQWLAVVGLPGALLVGGLDERIRDAVVRAVAEPMRPIAVLVHPDDAARWRGGRHDRLAAMVDEGWIEVVADSGAEPGDAVGATRAAQPERWSAEARAAVGATRAEQPERLLRRTPRGSEFVGSLHGGWQEVTRWSEEARAAGAGGTARAAGAGGTTRAAPERRTGEVGVEEARAAGAGGTTRAAPERRTGEVGAKVARAASPSGGGRVLDARSVAEATLFEALEATPATAGRFALNASLAVRFGGCAAEVDLLSRGDGIAIEIDGYHHFADLDGYRRDRRKDVLLQGEGLFVVRVLAEDVVRDARAAVKVVVQAMAYRMKEHG